MKLNRKNRFNQTLKQQLLEDIRNFREKDLITEVTGIVIKEVRLAKDIKVSSLSDITNISPGVIRLIERGKYTLCAYLFFVIAEALKVTPSELIKLIEMRKAQSKQL